MAFTHIEILGARTHNLKNVSTRIPLRKLTVITGPSGSGKSSLAFDTLYAEGQRRFVESMSTYARQFIEKMERPDVDQIRNIQPAIAIEQKNSVKNARSTIGTATEISDYLRILFAKAGITICPHCQLEVGEDSPQSVTTAVLDKWAGRRLYVIAPVPRNESVRGEALKAELVRAGFMRVLHNPEPPRAAAKAAGKKGKSKQAAEQLQVSADLTDPDKPYLDLDSATRAEIEQVFGGDLIRVVVDRLAADSEDRDRIASSIATAFQAGRGTAEVFLADALQDNGAFADDGRLTFHSGFRCNGCGRDFPRPEPNLFSFNSPLGACPKCSGFGRVSGADWEKVLPDLRLTMNEEPIAPFNSPSYVKNYKWIKDTLKTAKIPFDVPLEDLEPEQLEIIKFGSGKLEGIQAFFDWLETERYKVQARILISRYRGFTQCPDCKGTRLVPATQNIFWGAANGSVPLRNIGQVSRISIGDLRRELSEMGLSAHEEELFGRIHREVLARLTYLSRVGLDYLTLDRQTRTLSGGEAQRINLATALGTSLTQTLYVLDEPTVGLHPRDSRRLLGILRDLRDKGNTVVVVEHDTELILGADRILDIGPAAGSRGGQIMFEGSPEELLKDSRQSLTARYLHGMGSNGSHPPELMIAEPAVVYDAARKTTTLSTESKRVKGPCVSIVNAREHNLKGVTAHIPLNKWVCITGVSGSGKTTLIHSILYQGFNQHAKRGVEDMGSFGRIDGLEQISDIILVDQSPIGRSIRSNPVTYVKAYDAIRKLMASTREARTLGIGESAFSFNVAGGRCEICEGTGVTTYDMHFLAEITLPCEACGGKRFSPRILEVKYRGKNVDDILNMTVDDATEFFADQPTTIKRLAPLREVGLGYVTLGQNTSTLSGGEAQRLKLACYLSQNGNGERVMMIFDEPTTGLHLADLHVLAAVFRKLVQQGYSLVVIEHNLEIVRQADWIIDLGPEAGEKGGYVVASGTPEEIVEVAESHTGRFLKELIGQKAQPGAQAEAQTQKTSTR
jgi:excinuclease ABC subunit A